MLSLRHYLTLNVSETVRNRPTDSYNGIQIAESGLIQALLKGVISNDFE